MNKLKIKEDKKSITEVNVNEKEAIFCQEGELVVDIYETNASFVVLAAVAGVQIKDLDISVEKDMMVIRGNRQEPEAHPSKRYFYQECYWGPFSKKVVLPENLDVEQANAEMDKGLLTISIPKVEKNNEKIVSKEI